MKKLDFVRDILFISFAGYFAQGSLYTMGSLMSKLFLLLILGISIFYFLITVISQDKKSLFYKGWTFFLILNIIGFFLTGDFAKSHQFGMFKGVLTSSLVFYPAYYFASKGALKSKHMLRFFVLMLPIAIFSFFSNASEILSQRSSVSEDLVNNQAYGFVALMPFVFLIKRRMLSIVVMAFIMFFIIQGAKRGAVITGAGGIVLFIYYQLRTINKKNKVKGYALTFIGISGLAFYANDFYKKNEYLISRMQELDEGGVSGRDTIFATIFNSWVQSDNLWNLIFGYGFAASWDIAGNFAHNDWLELLSNFGLLGVTLYVIIFYAALKYIFNKQWTIDKRLLLLTVILSWFTISLFSMGYTNLGNGYVRAILLAYLIGNKNKMLI